MNAEVTSLTRAGARWSGERNPPASPGNLLRRVLGFKSPPRASGRPAVRHPFERLTFSNGTICEQDGEPLPREYMPLPPVFVVRKVSLKELEDQRCEYRFELNTFMDPIWRWFFQKQMSGLPVQFEGRVLVLTCAPADLEWSYQRVRAAITQANEWYSEEREQLAPRVVALEEERQAAREMEQNRKIGLRRQFECLPL